MRFLPSRILRAAATDKAKDWSRTLHLPKSSFPAAPDLRKLAAYRQRCSTDLHAWQLQSRNDDSKDFVLHDGPPYANGPVHVGHALNKILKDLVLRTELSRGKRVHYQPGWDCHGLPIELKALQQRKSTFAQAKARKDSASEEAHSAARSTALDDAEIRGAARQLASRAIEEQKKEFVEWGVMGDWDNPYTTMSKDFEIRQLEVFREMVKNDLIFRDYRPVYWSPSSRTALAESELEYDDKHKCTAAFIQMPLFAGHELSADDRPVYAVIWTTTPWTLPANKAVAVHPQVLYSLCEISNHDKSDSALYIIGHNRVDHVQGFLPDDQQLRVLDTITGAELVHRTSGCVNVFCDSESPIVTADWVSEASGTGLVHIAPGHGMEDYQLCLDKGIGPAFAPVDDAGRYTADVSPSLLDQSALQGLSVEKEGTNAVLSILQSPSEHLEGCNSQRNTLVLATHELVHKNPIDWRTKKPVIVRSTAQWFADVSRINGRAISSLDSVSFVPPAGKNRLTAFIQSRSQWCISRQRAWGVPIPVIYNRASDKENHSDEVIQHIINIIAKRGTDAWFTDAADDPAWFPSSFSPAEWVRKRDTMDVWFDSGTSWTLMKDGDQHKHADVYLEGSDQHRGWFQSSLLTKIASQPTASRPQAPYEKLITHGFTLDAAGRKMSKSIGNVIAPSEIISGSILTSQSGLTRTSKKKRQSQLGPDLLRLWVASCDYTKDVSISAHVVQTHQQALQKSRNTLRFMLGVLQHAEQTSLSTETLLAYDQIVLNELSKASKIIFAAYHDYKFFEGIREVNAFVNGTLSAFYFEIIKDTLYTGLQRERRRTRAVLSTILIELLHWLSPVTPHLVEEAVEHLPSPLRDMWQQDKDVPALAKTWHKPYELASIDIAQCDAAMAYFEPVSKAVKSAQERARADGKLGSGLACSVLLAFDEQTPATGGFDVETLRQALVLSELEITSEGAKRAVSSADTARNPPAWKYEELVEADWTAKVTILPPNSDKCPRCWQYTSAATDTLCPRCVQAVAEISE